VARKSESWSERLTPARIAASIERRARKSVYRDGGPEDQWCRIVMNRAIAEHLAGLHPEQLRAFEVSGTSHRHHGWAEHVSSRYPDFDICAPTAELDTYDVVICEQVLEHVEDPWRAARTLHDLCVPGGHVVVSTPFLIRVHPTPYDFWRFTEDGMRKLLGGSGLIVDETGSWGSRRAVRGNLRRFPPMRSWRSLRDETDFPLVVWAFARRAAAG